MLAEANITNEVDEEILKSVVTGIKGGCRKILKEQDQERHCQQGCVTDEKQDNVCCEVSISCVAENLFVSDVFSIGNSVCEVGDCQLAFGD